MDQEVQETVGKIIISYNAFEALVKAAVPTKDPNILVIKTDHLAVFDIPLKDIEQCPHTLIAHNCRLKPKDSGRSDYKYIYIQAYCRFTNNCPVVYFIRLPQKPNVVSGYIGKKSLL